EQGSGDRAQVVEVRHSGAASPEVLGSELPRTGAGSAKSLTLLALALMTVGGATRVFTRRRSLPNVG
ncbi:MAG: LPXTG cell wall anchor domain-containing protein, partial [Acidimicrobiia bacterium]